MKTLADEFAHFRQIVIDADASEAQVEDMQAAFMAGAICCLGNIVKAIMLDDDKETALRRLRDLVVECRKFDASMRADAAIIRAMKDKQ